MAAATTALAMSSAAARQLSRSASTIFTREVSGSHKLTIDGYSASRKIPQQPPQVWSATSQPFVAAGYTWRIRYSPNNRRNEAAGGDDDDDSISLYLELDNGDYAHQYYHHHHYLRSRPVPVLFKFSLLDLAGNPVPGFSRSKEQCVSPSSGAIGFDDFVKWKDLRESGAVDDDRFTISCDVTAIKDWSEPEPDEAAGGGAPVSNSGVVVPPSDLHQQLSDLLWKHKHGADVTIDVAGETFDAHGWLLAARSPVFAAELQALMTTSSSKKEKEKEKESSAGAAAAAGRRVLKIKGMKAKVFKAMLHFLYTDALPPLDMDMDRDDLELLLDPEQDDDGDRGAVEMARGLLVAAQRYKLDRLKLLCEEALCRRIGVGTVAAILVAAEEHRCQGLKAACLEFMARPGCMKAVMETRGAEEMKTTCLPLLIEILVRQLTLARTYSCSSC